MNDVCLRQVDKCIKCKLLVVSEITEHSLDDSCSSVACGVWFPGYQASKQTR